LRSRKQSEIREPTHQDIDSGCWKFHGVLTPDSQVSKSLSPQKVFPQGNGGWADGKKIQRHWGKKNNNKKQWGNFTSFP
jgi:hypothetical protein